MGAYTTLVDYDASRDASVIDEYQFYHGDDTCRRYVVGEEVDWEEPDGLYLAVRVGRNEPILAFDQTYVAVRGRKILGVILVHEGDDLADKCRARWGGGPWLARVRPQVEAGPLPDVVCKCGGKMAPFKPFDGVAVLASAPSEKRRLAAMFAAVAAGPYGQWKCTACLEVEGGYSALLRNCVRVEPLVHIRQEDRSLCGLPFEERRQGITYQLWDYDRDGRWVTLPQASLANCPDCRSALSKYDSNWRWMP